jgi:hypothetical protein
MTAISAQSNGGCKDDVRALDNSVTEYSKVHSHMKPIWWLTESSAATVSSSPAPSPAFPSREPVTDSFWFCSSSRRVKLDLDAIPRSRGWRLCFSRSSWLEPLSERLCCAPIYCEKEEVVRGRYRVQESF